MKTQTEIRLYAGVSPNGRPAYEHVLATPLEGRHHRIEKSPGLVLGIAAGDELDVREDSTFTVVKRAGNVCVQLFVTDNADRIRATVEAGVVRLGGWLDGAATRELVFTFPLAVGLAAIEQFFDQLSTDDAECEWIFGNVYAEDGITPLSWWKPAR
jgi:hypothetical protein|nr:DUF4265 domain-containing protein [Kofleriaceae bacterium]